MSGVNFSWSRRTLTHARPGVSSSPAAETEGRVVRFRHAAGARPVECRSVVAATARLNNAQVPDSQAADALFE